MRRHGKTSRRNVAERRNCYHGFSRRILATSLCYALLATSLASQRPAPFDQQLRDRKSTRLNSSHTVISYAVFCLKKKKKKKIIYGINKNTLYDRRIRHDKKDRYHIC